MGGDGKHLKFFRFRAPFVVEYTPESGWWWLRIGLLALDFNFECLAVEVANVGGATFGAFTYADLRVMDFSDYDYLVRKVAESHKEADKDGSGNDQL